MQTIRSSKHCSVRKVQNITDFSWFELLEQNMKYTICIQVKKCQ